ncbi:MAG: hypothetical protein AAGG48_15560 [Planctomycetota bacterium]
MRLMMHAVRPLLFLLFVSTVARGVEPTKPAWQQTRDQMVRVIKTLTDQADHVQTLRDLEASKSQAAMEKALSALVLLDVSINPESRVKIAARKTKITVQQERPTRFLVRIENMAGITAPLNFSTIDLATDPPTRAGWCSVAVIDSEECSKYFSGKKIEYKLLQMTLHQHGLREVRLVGDAGQGTQDLGFRATADILIKTLPQTASAGSQ